MSTPPASGRNANGTFAPGNTFAKGNPYGKRVGELRSALLGSVSDQDWNQILARLVQLARQGEPWAVREVLDRTVGRHEAVDLAVRLEQLEQTLTARENES